MKRSELGPRALVAASLALAPRGAGAQARPEVAAAATADASAAPAPAVALAGEAVLEVSAPGAVIVVDGRAVARERATVTLAPGAHRVRARAEGMRTQERALELRAGERRSESFALAPERSLAANPWFWVVVGGGAALTAGGVAYVLATMPYYGSFDRQLRFEAP